jgi:hypothetical protein
VIKSLNVKNLAVSVRRGLWRTHRNNERTLNEAYASSERVVFFFSVNESGHWQVGDRRGWGNVIYSLASVGTCDLFMKHHFSGPLK